MPPNIRKCHCISVRIGGSNFSEDYRTLPRGEFTPRQTRQLPRVVDLKGRFLFLVVVKC
jgi:hypothetical protein